MNHWSSTVETCAWLPYLYDLLDKAVHEKHNKTNEIMRIAGYFWNLLHPKAILNEKWYCVMWSCVYNHVIYHLRILLRWIYNSWIFKYMTVAIPGQRPMKWHSYEYYILKRSLRFYLPMASVSLINIKNHGFAIVITTHGNHNTDIFHNKSHKTLRRNNGLLP